MPREFYIIFFVLAVGVLYLGVPKFLTNFTSTFLGKLSLVVFVLFMSLQYGKNAALVSSLCVIFLLSHSREGMAVNLPGDKEEDNEEEKKEEDKEEESDDETDDEKEKEKTEEDAVITCDSKDLNDKQKKQCETCVRQGKKDNADYKGYRIKSGEVTCMTQAQLHDLDRELKKGKKDSEEGTVSHTNGNNEEEGEPKGKGEPSNKKQESFTNYY